MILENFMVEDSSRPQARHSNEEMITHFYLIVNATQEKHKQLFDKPMLRAEARKVIAEWNRAQANHKREFFYELDE